MRNTTIIPVLSLLLAGACVTEVDETESSTDQELAVDDGVTVPAELTLDTTADFDQRSKLGMKTNISGGVMEAQRYCVDQSYASADYVSCEGQFMTCQNPTWDTRLSRNHPVHIFGCGSGTYVNVHSLWNPGLCYWMRRDAFRPC